MKDISLLQPPLALLVLLGAAGLFSLALSRFSMRRRSKIGDSGTPYACGEDLKDHMIQPNYGEFLPFAFFFTIMHVIALMAATIPMATAGAFVFAGGYVGCALIGLYVLYSR